MTVKERYQSIIKEGIEPSLREFGFKKKGTKYKLEGDHFIYSICFRRPWYNNEDRLSFGISWEIDGKPEDLKDLPFPFLASFLFGKLERTRPHTKFMAFVIENHDPYWEIKDQEMIQFFKSITPFALQKILSITTIQDVITLLETTSKEERYWEGPLTGYQTQDWLASLYYLIGQKEKAVNLLEKFIKDPKNKNWRKGLEELRDQMLSGLKS
ncbi:MAG TPA: hypothetical protein PLY23_09000 [Alphaproteobacteria bacterium]|nr:hypothetical protein [Alphaproteobacteria bacterium]HQS94750.1 hypothetical protein [Alphaproteobacteria bacterium]